LTGRLSVQVKRDLATRLGELDAEGMETQLWRPNGGIAELGKDNLYHLGSDGLEPITMVMVEFRRGRPAGEAGDLQPSWMRRWSGSTRANWLRFPASMRETNGPVSRPRRAISKQFGNAMPAPRYGIGVPASV
jgi:hypothetical protein